MLCQKGYYPYEWVDDIKKLNHKGLPPRANFYNKLKQELISEEEYQHALKVYDTLGCKTFKDYHLAYLKCDVLLLADVFEKFRKTCMTYYDLDPANYLTAPGLAWDAMLLKTGVKLELITDIEVLNMYESMKRGGVCFVGTKRHVKANNKYLEDYDETQESSYIMYWDANNLYGFAMSQYLPYADFKFIDNDDETFDKLLKTPSDSDIGYTTKIDFSYPNEIHDKLKEFVPAPESITPKVEWFSDFQKELGVKTKAVRYNEKTGEYTHLGSNKLVPHLFKHENYVIDYRNLQFLVGLGIKIEKVHAIMSYKQKPFLKPYIDFNTEKRKGALNEFEKDFFKLMNNSVFGKTMENVKNRVDIKLTTDYKAAVKYFSQIAFKESTCIDGLYLMQKHRKEIEYDKPIYVGTTILDLSKLCMMDFHYNVIHKNFEGRYSLLYTDTDSLVYVINHPDIYEWIKNNKQHFDLSDSLRPSLYDNTNKKKLGVFKDEMHSLLITEFIGLNPKVYSLIYQKPDDFNKIQLKNKKVLKGVSKAVVKKEITHDDYINTKDNNKILPKTVTSLRSFNHQIFTYEEEKTALTPFYDKMVMLNADDNIPFGYDPN